MAADTYWVLTEACGNIQRIQIRGRKNKATGEMWGEKYMLDPMSIFPWHWR